MNSALIQLAQDFSNYKGNLKRIKFPTEFWNRAVALCEEFSIKEVAAALKVCSRNLRRHICRVRQKEETAFLPIKLTPNLKQELQNDSADSSISIQFSGSATGLAEFMKALLTKGDKAC